MSFADRLTRCPAAYDPQKGREAADAFRDLPETMQDLVAGAAGSSPYLANVIGQESDWLAPELERAPEDAARALIDSLATLPDRTLGDELRRAKRRLAVLVALADLGGVWPLEDVTGTLTRFADAAVDAALKSCVAAEIARGKLPGMTEADRDRAAGMTVLAMGKMGAGELNYSSDIDLICLFDEEVYDEDAYLDARSALIRATRKMTALLSETTGEGYVFRTDLRLRPDPGVTPVCLSMDAAERYYESLGRTWERAAYVKARACAGDIAAGERFLEALTPFVWRKHLDFWAIRDAHDMRLKIRSHKGLGGPITLPGHDMKLGRGGIREIEFFTQTRQIIAGGRDPSLRVRGTVEGLSRLADAGWVPRDVTDTLSAEYRAHREVEHRLQMVNDAQTHDLPQDDAGFDRLAALMGRDVSELKADLADRLERVRQLTEDFFDPGARPEDEPDLTEGQAEIVARWRSYPALRSERAQAIFERVKPVLLEKLDQTADPDRTLVHLDGFLSGLPAGVQLFALLDANPTLIDLLIDIAGTSPALASYLSRNSGVFDAVIGGAFFEEWPGREALTDDLARALAASHDYEAQLDAARRWAKEWHFRIGVHHLRGLIDAATARTQYADLAEAVLNGVWPAVVDSFAERHGPPPGDGAAVLGMGSLGAGRLNATSDLDLIVIYEEAGVESSDGPKPLNTRAYYARLTQALVTALSAPMPAGKLYEVDMRLRPSGKQGPVATAFSAFRRYQAEEAWTWEHLALTRARPVAGAEKLGAEIAAFRQELLDRPRDTARVMGNVETMRTRLAEAQRGAPGPLEAKAGPGRLQDIELLSSALALLAPSPEAAPPDQIAAGEAAGLVTADEAATLAATHRLLSAVQAGARLLTGEGIDPDALVAGGEALLLRETGTDSVGDLIARVAEASDEAAGIIETVLSRHGGMEARDAG
ncbi:glutamate-ammonia-ligase adenylyltransferase [Tranquillimonas rosea]|uniref:Glutamate-ammonia-ligase adenylyltransferase n=1 Tax=Tranquillimonas rosea TaxID=641238 RepID=A0A1H9TN77_9RHOB|nr:glutamine-synthetase adenylyltransferase [Tranquillimonas rosea]SER98517.1 glutamate-ammonia-ligase adenylyltransferase [Tranquillimonas rosea]